MIVADGYHIYIHLDELAEESSVAGGGGDARSQKSYSEKSAQSVQKAVKGIVSYSSAKSTADKIISYEIGHVGLQTGAREYEQRLEQGYSIAKQVWSVGESIVIGAATGNLPLALAMIAVSGIQFGISAAQKYQTIRTEKALEDTSLGMSRIRAGIAGSRGVIQ